MDQYTFTCVAYACPLCLGIDDNRNHLGSISILIDIDMTVSGARFQYRYRCIFNRIGNQSGTAAGNQHIEICIQLHKGSCRFPGGILQKCDDIRTEATGSGSPSHTAYDNQIALQNIFAATQHNRIAGF